eukprot:Nitzschia sp. Nitz4//scaffold47_size129522//7382//9295//NITZ4_003532-RA/size129522-snap-gene-0.180-mRNA-1//1//CDS//3329552743//7109//frame0
MSRSLTVAAKIAGWIHRSNALKQVYRPSWTRATLPLAMVATTTFAHSFATHHTTKNDSSSDKPNEETSSGSPSPNIDVTSHWNNGKEFLENFVFSQGESKEASPSTSDSKEEQASSQSNASSPSLFQKIGQAFLDKVPIDTSGLGGSEGDSKGSSSTAKETVESERNLQDVRQKLMGLLSGGNQQQSVEDLITKARASSEQGDLSDSVSFEEVMTILRTVGTEFDQTIKNHLEGQDLPTIYPISLYYFFEYEDERKNFSWRRRKHRFCPGIDIDQVTELNGYMRLAELGYAEDSKQIQEELRSHFGYEMVFCQMDSLPHQPSHYLAVKKEQSRWSSSLDVMLCVRGTATITDVITDLLADAVDYKGGKAHSGICRSGKYLAEKHKETLLDLLKASGKKKIQLTLIGHSLGAGAASIAGMELQDLPEFDVKVIGFGCPALVSENLSEASKDYITTIVSDNDCIPRMSLANMINTVRDIGEYNWISRARVDLEDIINQVQKAFPTLLPNAIKSQILNLLDTKVLSSIDIPPATPDRMEPVLFPPGKCIHFYRDGYGLAGAVVPCTFFDSIDVNRRMVDDHLFDTGYRLVFLDLMRQVKKDNYFQFDIKK